MDIFYAFHFLAQATPPPAGAAEVEASIVELRSFLDNDVGFRGVVTLLLTIGVSVAIGRSYVLLANRVTPVRLVASMLLGIVILAVSLLVWTTAVFWIGRYFYDITFTLNYWESFALVVLMFSPLTQAWLGLMPYLGSCFIRLQYVFSVVLLWLAMLIVGFRPVQALVVILAGGAVLLIAQRTILLPLIALQNRAAGTHLRKRYRNVIRDSRLELQ